MSQPIDPTTHQPVIGATAPNFPAGGIFPSTVDSITITGDLDGSNGNRNVSLLIDEFNGDGIITIEGNIGSIAPFENITVTANAFNLGGSITAESGITLDVPVTITTSNPVEFNTGTGTIALNQGINAGDVALTLTGDNLTLAGTVEGTSLLTLQPASTDQAITLGTETGFGLTQAELDTLQNFESVTIGRTDGTGGITVADNISFSLPTILEPGTSAIALNNNITNTGSGADLTLGTTILDNDVTLTTTNGNLTFNGTVDSATGNNFNLGITTGSGNITFNDTIGSTTPLADLNLTNTGTITLPTTTLSGAFTQANASAVTLSGNLTAGGDISMTSPLQLTEATTITTTNGSITLAAEVTGSDITATSTGNLTTSGINATGDVTLTSANGTITTTTIDGTDITATSEGALNTGAIAATGTVDLTSSNGTITTTTIEGTDITAISNGDLNTGAIAADGTINLTSTTGAIDVEGVSGTDVAIAAQTDLTTGAIAATGTVDLTSSAGTITTTTIDGIDITATSNRDLNTGAVAATGTVNLTSTTGAIDVDGVSGTDVAIAAQTDLTTGAIAATGTVDLTSSNGTITTTTIDGTDITATSEGALNTGAIAASGTVNLTSSNGTITTTTIEGTDITAVSNGDLNTGAIAANGDINLASTTGAIGTDGISGNNVAIAAQTGLTTGAIESTAGATLTTTTGNVTIDEMNNSGGALQIQTGGGAIATGNITSPGANVNLQATTGITTDRINTDNTTGTAGNIRLTPNGPLQTSQLSAIGTTNQGGNIIIDSNVELTDDLRIITNGGNVRFSGTVDSDNTSDNTLDIDADDGNITFRDFADLTTLRLDTTGRLTLANGLTLTNALRFPDAAQVRLGGTFTIGTGNISVSSPVTLLSNTTFNTQSRVRFREAIRGRTNNLTVNSLGDITTQDINTNGGNIRLNTFGEITTQDLSTNGGNIRLNTLLEEDDDTTTITTGNLTTQNENGGGNVTVLAGLEITTGDIDTSATTGNGGNVFLDPVGDIEVGFINTQSENAVGGDITATTESFFRATDTFTTNDLGDNGGILASLSALGGTQGGEITITHDGGARLTYFNIDNLNDNGTAAAIVSGTSALPNIIPSGEAYLGPYTQFSAQGTIDLITDPVSTPSALDTDEVIQRDNDEEQSDGFGLEDYFFDEFENYFSQQGTIPIEPTEILTLEEIQDTLRQVEEETGVRSGVLYAYFAPEGAFELWEEVENIRPGMFSVDVERPWMEYRQQQESWMGDALNLAEDHDDGLDKLGLVLVMPNAVTRVDNVDLTRRDATRRLESFLGIIRQEEEGYIRGSLQFYDWLITDGSDGIEAALDANGIEHLTFILDHELRGLPIAALQRSPNQYIIENLSVNVMPSFSLTNAQYVPFERSRLLAMGTADFSQVGQSPLLAVPYELHNIGQMGEPEQELWDNVLVVAEDEFTVDNLLNNYDSFRPEAIHLATHVNFKEDSLNGSFLYFNNQQVSLTEVRNWELNDPVINLMLLSACQTVVGNESAELGFSGVAYQARVNSVLGSLWRVPDWPTALLMTAFHHTLANGNPDPEFDERGDAMIKAIALQQVQQAFVRGDITLQHNANTDTYQMEWTHRDGRESDIWPIPDGIDTSSLSRIPEWQMIHPYYWSSFVVVGSPW